MFALTVRILAILAVPQTTTISNAAEEPVVINPDSRTYDYHPSASRHDDGTMWVAWHGYHRGRDQILARQIESTGKAGPLQQISSGGTVHSPPVLVTGSQGSVFVIWARRAQDRWQVRLRERRGNGWRNPLTLSPPDHDAVFPTAVLQHDGSVLVAWSELIDGSFRVRGCRVVRDSVEAGFDLSESRVDACRPTLVADGRRTWAFWDEYHRPNYSVHGRIAWPQRSPIRQISPRDEYCLTPTATAHAGRLCVAWLRKVDTVGGPGVISQWHTLHAAIRSEDGWNLVRTPAGDSTAAELTQGLMAQIQPKAVATGGYLGPRLRPTLLADDEGFWLLWERKSNHRGSTPTVTGDLVARRAVNGQWQSPVVLTTGRLDYHAIHPAVVRDTTVQLIASPSPRKGLRTYHSFAADLRRTAKFRQQQWIGWNPIQLPVAAEVRPRREIVADGCRYKLFWADLHCHNGLTADAEGQPDELHNYARDRAALDVVVFTNNDFYNVPLTQYEYALGELCARVWSDPARNKRFRPLLSLPGYEWTSRIPGIASARLSDPGNWLPPYQNKSFPNHRSVIYPPSGGPLVHFMEVENNIARLNEAVQAAGGITLSQHNAFRLSGHPVEVGLELTSGWSNYIASHQRLFHTPLNNGAKLGFTANGDTHRRAPGLSGALTGIYAESLTADAILDALRKRRCFATMGAQMFVDARANGSLMGAEVAAPEGRVELTLNVTGTRDVVRARLIRDGKVVYQVDGAGSNQIMARFVDTDVPAGSHWYYWEVRQARDAPVLPGNLMVAHGHLAWSSPHFVSVPTDASR